MRDLYPPIEPYRRDRLPVSDLHTLYLEECGNPDGQPVVFLHGGPGGGIQTSYRRFFDPKQYRVVLFDQRGCGQSTPHAELTDNTTWHLVEDIERVRSHLGIDRWIVFGGSWGSTLALTYAETYPKRCKGLILRGIFMLRKQEIQWFYQSGASNLFPDAWEGYLAPIPADEQDDLVAAYYKRLTSEDPTIRLTAARAWSSWEAKTSKLLMDPALVDHFEQDEFATAFARIECHYFANDGFFTEDNYLLRRVDCIRHIPTVIVQGRYDVVCPMVSAWDLHRAFPEAELIVIPDAGHSMTESGIQAELLNACDRFATL